MVKSPKGTKINVNTGPMNTQIAKVSNNESKDAPMKIEEFNGIISLEGGGTEA